MSLALLSRTTPNRVLMVSWFHSSSLMMSRAGHGLQHSFHLPFLVTSLQSICRLSLLISALCYIDILIASPYHIGQFWISSVWIYHPWCFIISVFWPKYSIRHSLVWVSLTISQMFHGFVHKWPLAWNVKCSVCLTSNGNDRLHDWSITLSIQATNLLVC